MFQLIKQRMKGAQNISQITKAMELVAATKMRRSQEIAIHSRPYAYTALDILRTVAALEKEEYTPPLFTERAVTRTAIVLITSDKGLAGSFNSNVIKKFEQFVREEKISSKENYVCIAVGKKAHAYLEKQGYTILQSFVRAGDFTTPEETRPIAELLGKLYSEKTADRVLVFSTHFRTALAQETIAREILPMRAEMLTRTINNIVPEKGKYSELRSKGQETESKRKSRNLLIEPAPAEVLESISAHLLHMELYHLFMEANASEHAARRMAMKNASENAGELVQTLTITYNKLRQAAITKEITEITAGAEALAG
ncbi:MAG: ATP synthase F1 subunit gamma [Patescibacteria group bacterium]|nr:ATP synthase F1 subunit gamma [Patescibacteria group bacterium]